MNTRREATASVLSVIRNVSVPFGIADPEHPNLSATQWRTLADHGERAYYFDSVVSPGVFWVDLDGLDLSEAGASLRLDVPALQDQGRSGDVTGEFSAAEPFAFAPVT